MAVIKVIPWHDPQYYRLIAYITRLHNNELPQIFAHNLRSGNVRGWTREFLQNEAHRKHPRRGQVYLYHSIVSFHPKDTPHLTSEVLSDLARKFIELRGPAGLYLGSVHRNRGHIHLHLCSSGTALYTGKAMRQSRAELAALKTEFQQYCRDTYPQIKYSRCDHGSRKPYKKERNGYLKQRAAEKAWIEPVVRSCFTNAKTQQAFIQLLQHHDLHHYERMKAGRTHIEGVVSPEGIKFRFSCFGIDPANLPTNRSQVIHALNDIRAIRTTLEREEKHDQLIDNPYTMKTITKKDHRTSGRPTAISTEQISQSEYPSTFSQAKDELKVMSHKVRPLVKEGKYRNINEAIIDVFYRDASNTEFKTMEQWNKNGYQVKKGAKAYVLWGRPIELESKEDGIVVHDMYETPDPETHYPVAHVFSNSQTIAKKKVIRKDLAQTRESGMDNEIDR